MEKTSVVKNKSDVIVKASNFVFEHTKNDLFQDYYVLDPVVIGEGAFGCVHKCVKKGTTEERAVKKIKKNKMNDSEKIRL